MSAGIWANLWVPVDSRISIVPLRLYLRLHCRLSRWLKKQQLLTVLMMCKTNSEFSQKAQVLNGQHARHARNHASWTLMENTCRSWLLISVSSYYSTENTQTPETDAMLTQGSTVSDKGLASRSHSGLRFWISAFRQILHPPFETKLLEDATQLRLHCISTCSRFHELIKLCKQS